MKQIILFLAFLLVPSVLMADSLDDLEALLRDKPQVHEKIYVHTDNSCYFVGDTLWYKAYVVRADNLHPTNYSKLLYVELLTPDGYVVERQHVVTGANGSSCGQFVLQDSLYSGYYEIRAYTRWNLNFNVREKNYTRDDRLKFYSKQDAADFFRDFEGLYSRVIPVYQRPREAGDYVDRYMAKRPKQRVLKEKESAYMSFYPEGGQLVQGLPCNIAYEIKDNNGQYLDLEARLSDGKTVKPQHLGMGHFTFTPQSESNTMSVTYNGKQYNFKLPKAVEAGVALTLNAENRTATVKAKGVTAAAYAVLCRGKLVTFSRLSGENVTLPADLPTGINELVIYDTEANPLASRLFFIDNKDYGKALSVDMTAAGGAIEKKTTLKPYEKVQLTLTKPAADTAMGDGMFSVAVRDQQTDDCGYDNGNIMTDMLLSSELKGFIAYPGYYFEADDAKHRADLDLLMQVQGWRRYKRVAQIRYLPEQGLTYEGTVNKIPDGANMLELEDMNNLGANTASIAEKMIAEAEASIGIVGNGESEVDEGVGIDANATYDENVEYADGSEQQFGMKAVRKSVLVEAELNKDGETAGAITTTNSRGQFVINLPPFYDKAILFVKAYNRTDSLKKNMQSKEGDKGKLDERAYPDYFVKRNMFFPIFSQPYSWYQTNSPALRFVDEEDDELIPENSKLAGDHMLQTVVVKARRRGKRAIDMTKPAIVRDAYDVYNDMSDYGLSYGVVDFRRLPLTIATYMFGNMGRANQFNIRAMIDGSSFYRNYTPLANEFDRPIAQTALYEKLRLNKMQDVRIFTDYELRTDSGDVEEAYSADVTIDFVPMPDDGKRYTYRDRRYVIDGITYAEEFYNPDYSGAIPTDPKDYRRTLYWNPNARLEEDGTFHATFYNNSRETRIAVSAAGIDSSGQMYYK